MQIRPRRGVINEKADTGLDSWGARLVRMRDMALVGFGAVYAFGYIARALHAWMHDLGVLPGVELQYFVAGVLLLIPPALVALVLLGAWRLLQRVARWEGDDAERRKRSDTWTGAVLIAGMLLMALAGAASATGGGRFVPKAVTNAIEVIAIVMAIIGFMTNVGLQFARPSRVEPEAAPRGGARRAGVLGVVSRTLELLGAFLNTVFVANLGLLTAWLLLLGMLLAVLVVLPWVPQALGGAAPRCAQFDIAPAALSAEMAAVLSVKQADAGVPAATSPQRTRKVLVYYAGSDALLFKLPDAAARNGETFELKRLAIGAILWCRDAQDDPAAEPQRP